jgi:hypothetical protein
VGFEGDQPNPENLPLSGEMVGNPNEFLIPGSRGEGLRSLGISFIGETTGAGVRDSPLLLELGTGVVFLASPKNPVFSRVGDGKGGGPMSDVDRFLF